RRRGSARCRPRRRTRRALIVLVGSVLQHPAGRVLIAVGGMLDQLTLGFLEALGLATAGLVHRLLSGIALLVGRRRLGAGLPTDTGRLGSRGVLLLAFEFGFGHA